MICALAFVVATRVRQVFESSQHHELLLRCVVPAFVCAVDGVSAYTVIGPSDAGEFVGDGCFLLQ